MWIRTKDNVPTDGNPVLVTFVNRKPPYYWEHIKDKPFVSVAMYNGDWYWWDLHNDCVDEKVFTDMIEITAWMPMPSPYKEDEE